MKRTLHIDGHRIRINLIEDPKRLMVFVSVDNLLARDAVSGLPLTAFATPEERKELEAAFG